MGQTAKTLKRILFVDDDPNVLTGLRNVLRTKRREWDMVFAIGPDEALAKVAEGPFDVVVSDMRMPRMDGATFLARVKQLQPQAVRMILSGQTELESVMKSVFIAHMFLSKPCDPALLQQVVDRACRLQAILNSDELRASAGKVEMLPAAPKTYVALNAALMAPNCSVTTVARIIERDIGLCAKLLQLVNSAFFCLPYHVTSVRGAVAYLGLDTLKQLVLSIELFSTVRPRRHIAGFSLAEFEEHSHLTARIAARLPASEAVVAAGVVASVLHDAGKLVMAAHLPNEFERALEASRSGQRPLHVVDMEQMGTTHAEIGAYLLGLWGLSGAVVDAVSRHHRPEVAEGGEAGLDVLGITHLADGLAWEAVNEKAGEAAPVAELLNHDYLAQLGVTAELPGWRAMAQQVRDGAKEG